MDVIAALVRSGAHNMFPAGEAIDNSFLPPFWQEVNDRQHHMVLEREPAIGRLDPVILSHARHLAGKQSLIFATSDMFNDGVAEYDIESPIGEGKHPAIRAYQVGVL